MRFHKGVFIATVLIVVSVLGIALANWMIDVNAQRAEEAVYSGEVAAAKERREEAERQYAQFMTNFDEKHEKDAYCKLQEEVIQSYMDAGDSLSVADHKAATDMHHAINLQDAGLLYGRAYKVLRTHCRDHGYLSWSKTTH